MLKVCEGKCDQCLFSPRRIVPVKRMKAILDECKQKQHHFMCHKESDVVCGGFYQKMGFISQMVRIAERLNAIQFVKPKGHS